jgi:uncharacterized repeat protein (TIGR03943 family)
VRVDARAARGGVLAAWAVFFVVLWLTGASARYLGARTEWVVPFGAIVLALAAIAYAVLAVRTRSAAPPLTLREAVGLVSLLVPLAAVLVAPNAALGSFAAGRKDGGGLFRSARPAVPKTPADASFLDIRVAEGDPTFALEAGIEDGLRVRLVGIVTGSKDGPPGTFELARFYVACCIADAQPVGIPVDPSGLSARRYAPDTWLDVTGTLDRRGRRFVVEADRIEPTSRPDRPYLTFRF